MSVAFNRIGGGKSMAEKRIEPMMNGRISGSRKTDYRGDNGPGKGPGDPPRKPPPPHRPTPPPEPTRPGRKRRKPGDPPDTPPNSPLS
ncbi:MAG: hypothetical protein GF417_07745 [Candidatus Latescibacteria bacterium]|nr:hypothetical protein [bacterium]MBD3424312.1 hypothetical protein [Candidatus Latescibacterota bacterium]